LADVVPGDVEQNVRSLLTRLIEFRDVHRYPLRRPSLSNEGRARSMGEVYHLGVRRRQAAKSGMSQDDFGITAGGGVGLGIILHHADQLFEIDVLILSDRFCLGTVITVSPAGLVPIAVYDHT